jgi:hypothetical protein
MKFRTGFAVVGCIAVLLLAISLSACERNEWSKAQKANTVEAYKAFLEKYPKGKFVVEAALAIEKIEWEKAEKANTIEAYEAFLDKQPDSKQANIARERIAALEEQKLGLLEKEAIDNLAAIHAAEENYKTKQQAARKKVLYLACKPSPPNGGTGVIPDPWVDAGGFTQLGFMPEKPVIYQYAVVVDKSGKSYTGDLDEDGTKVTFTITNENPAPVKSPENEH